MIYSGDKWVVKTTYNYKGSTPSYTTISCKTRKNARTLKKSIEQYSTGDCRVELFKIKELGPSNKDLGMLIYKKVR